MSDTTVWTVVKLPGFHRWALAPDHRAYLRDRHRHLFHVRVEVAVSHDDRDVEFHDLQDEIRRWWGSGTTDHEGRSCEQIARRLGAVLQMAGIKVIRVIVSEDGESGATVTM